MWTADWPVSGCEVSPDGRSVVVALSGRADLVTLYLAHKSLPPLEEHPPEEVLYGEQANRGKEFDLS